MECRIDDPMNSVYKRGTGTCFPAADWQNVITSNVFTMQTLRKAHHIARLVLAWFVLSLGVAVASPIVKPHGMELICSGYGATKLVQTGDDGKSTSAQLLGMDCPLCAGVSAPPPFVALHFSAIVPTGAPTLAPIQSVYSFHQSAPPPARGPPRLI